MTKVIRIRCPECAPNKGKRIEELRESIAHWVYDEEFRHLLKQFGISIHSDCSLEEYIKKLWEEIQIWDFRKGRERWSIGDKDTRIEANKNEIEAVSKRLGLMNITETIITDPDYILPLGGARMTNYDTPLKAKELIDAHEWSNLTVVGLSTERKKTERDAPFFEKYAPGAETEFEAMCGGVQRVFGLSEQYVKERNTNSNPFLCSESRVYSQAYRKCRIAAVAAPSSEPDKRRANTIDTFVYFQKVFNAGSECKAILTTNCIYVPFQTMAIMKIALEKNIMIDCVGAEAQTTIPEGKSSRYLQEIKAAVDAIYNMASIVR